MKIPDFGPLAESMLRMVDKQELAEAAADNTGRGKLICMKMRDALQNDIIIGYCLVVVIYGSEEAMKRVEEKVCLVTRIE